MAAEKDKYYYKCGKLLANPSKGDEVVISGMAGKFPSCRDIYELRENLFNKVDMVTVNKKWDYDKLNIPSRMGTVSEVDKYDAGFFGVHERQSHSLDAMARIFQEKSMEAIFDAGLHPSELQNTKTGVYVGVTTFENDRVWYYDNLDTQNFAVTGCEKSMIAHRLSYFLKLKGPSFVLDTGCSSSCHALEIAYRAIRLGEIDSAIVGGVHLCLNPYMVMALHRYGTSSKDGTCKSFDDRADGYARSEGFAVVLLQKAKNSKRVYAHLIHIKTNCDGFKEQGISFLSSHSQEKLLSDFYQDCEIDRFSLSFLEAHGTGTKVGDPQECAAIDSVLTYGRKKPLLIGSIKSNIGHTEPVSCLCSIIKCILGMEIGYIPPNIHFKRPNKALIGIIEGRLKVVVDKTPLEENALMAVNNFGIGGVNAHLLLRRNPKQKAKTQDNLPRLVFVSGRTEEAVTVLLDQSGSNEADEEYIKLLHEVFSKNIENHLYRGYTVVSQLGTSLKSFVFCPEQGKSIYLAFGHLENWWDVGKQLIAFPAFHDSILRIQENLPDKNVCISSILLDNGLSNRDSIPVVGAVAVQISILHLLNLTDVKTNGCCGFSFGELVSSYYNKFLTLDETIYCAFVLNKAILNSDEFKDTSTKGSQIAGTSAKEYKGNSLIDEILLKVSTKVLAKHEDLVNKIKRSNYFKNALVQNRSHTDGSMKQNSIILEVGDCPLVDKEVSTISLFGSESESYLDQFLKCLGSLYLSGYNPQIDRLYPPVAFPVSRGTSMISPYIRWNHSREKFLPEYHLGPINQDEPGIGYYRIDLAEPQWEFLAGHLVDGKHLFPITGYLYMVWETFAAMHGVPLNASRVSLKNCRFLKTTSFPATDIVEFTVSILRGSGEFEILDDNFTVVVGTISFLPNEEMKVWNIHSQELTNPSCFPMSKKEVYKELRLRGYSYSGEFQGIEDYNYSMFYVKWHENWITFIDNMLQSRILLNDDRSLQVPVFIFNVDIAADVHLELAKETFKDSEETPPLLPVYIDKYAGIFKCGGITVSGITTSVSSRRQNMKTPVLEKYEFVPNFAELYLHKSVKINIQIILENTLVRKLKAVELIDESSDGDIKALMPIVKSVLQEEILVEASLKILSSKTLKVDVDVENKKLDTETDCVLVVASKIINRPEILKLAFGALKETGFVISRENPCCDIRSVMYPDIAIITVHRTPSETLLLLRKHSLEQKRRYIEVDTSEGFSWLPEVQEALNDESEGELVLYSEDSTNGILGMVTCLRKESCNKNVRCVFVINEKEECSSNFEMYNHQLKKNMAFNVYKDGQWGTFRHFLLDKLSMEESEHCLMDIPAKGDLSSLEWVKGPLGHSTIPEPGQELVHVYYSSLNFKDVIATEKIDKHVDQLGQNFFLGLEFSGRDSRGNRVMGSSVCGAISNLLVVDKLLMYRVPEEWTLEEAATVPAVYTTAIYALIMRGHIRRGESILIHSGTEGVGQAAIHIALHYGCQVFTTVDTQEKREFIKKIFPQLKDKFIGNSKDESFEQMVFNGTNGRGVNIVLNSLTEEKLIASMRCLATGSRFLNISRLDLVNNSHINLMLFKKQASFHGVMLDSITDDFTRTEIRKEFQKVMSEGGIKPLNRNIFKRDEIEQAFRFMIDGKDTGKLLVNIQQNEEQHTTVPSIQMLKGVPRYYCDSRRVYIIVGGLGGFGLELANWLVLRGARKLVLTSRKGISTGYQQYRIRLWESYGVVVKISTVSLATREGCKQLIKYTLQLGGVVAIFNLAVVLQDAIFENQTPTSFTIVFEAKAVIVKHLDDVSRTMCPHLRDFVVFSSGSCGKGNQGQTNYGMANAVMERICEKRKLDGYPGLAIQWGTVGDVGIVAEMQDNITEIGVGGTTQQSISSCLQVLDTLLLQKESAVVSSMVVAQKQKSLFSDNIVDAVISVLGLRDAKYVSAHSTLAELGMDSMTVIETKLTLERNFEVFLSVKDLRTMTLARLKMIQEELEIESIPK